MLKYRHAERCPSGLRCGSRKSVRAKTCRGFESHPLRFFILCSVTFYGGMRTHKSKTCIGSSARQQRAKCFCAALSVLSKTRSLVYRCRVRQSHPLRFFYFVFCNFLWWGESPQGGDLYWFEHETAESEVLLRCTFCACDLTCSLRKSGR